LLSDDGGKTFQEWVNMLGGKSVNGMPVIFPYEDAVHYHLYWKVLNAKHHGVPQNRERVFLIGIRDDEDNNFQFPKEEHLTKRLKDVLEENVADKYFLSENQIENITKSEFTQEKERIQGGDYSGTLLSRDYKSPKCVKIEKFSLTNQDVIVHNIPEIVKVRKNEVRIIELQELLKNRKKISNKEIAKKLNVPKTKVEHWFRKDKFFAIPDAEIWFDLKELLKIKTNEFDLEITEFEERAGVFEKSNRVYGIDGISPTMTATSSDEKILVSKEVRTDESKKQRKKTGTNDFRGKEIEFREQDHMNTITTSLTNDHFLKVGTWRTHDDGKGFREIEDGNCPTIPARAREDGSGQPVVMQLNPSLESGGKQPYQQNRIYDSNAISPVLNAGQQTWGGNIVTLPNNYKIRRLTPRECFRLMDFPDTFTWNVSDSQAYKQAGNSIVVGVLEKIIKKLPL
jgi:site-specific DNA-cytosine methylase